MTVRIKVCGIRTPDDARRAVDAGADAIGLILSPARRRVTADVARAIVDSLPPFVTPVGVFVDETLDHVDAVARALGLGAVQLHGDETPEMCDSLTRRRHRVVKALRVDAAFDSTEAARYPAAGAILLDTRVEGARGGTGVTFPWGLADGLSVRYRLIVAGGLDPGNVAGALDALRPYAVDVTSGVETDDRKDPGKLRAFVGAVRAWEGRQAAAPSR